MNGLKKSFFDSLGATGEESGFRACFPVLSWLVFRPQITGVLALTIALLLYRTMPLVSLGVLCLWTVPVSLFLERRLLDRMLFPPFTAVVCWGALGAAVGVPVMYSSSYFAEFYRVYGVENWLPVLEAVQGAYLFAFPFGWLGYSAGGFRRIAPIRGDGFLTGISVDTREKLLMLGWILFLITVVLLAAKSLTGVEDRSIPLLPENLVRAASSGPRLLLNLLPKFGMMGFVFVPILWKSHRARGRCVLIVLLGIYSCFALASGSRGLFLYMVFFIFMGGYLFRQHDTPKFEISLLVIIAVGALLTSMLLAYRTSQDFTQTRSKDVLSRLTLLFKPSIYHNSSPSPESIYRFGFSLFGYDDAIIFALTPARIPRAGFDGMSAVVWTWIPTTVCPGKTPLLDAEHITGSYEVPPVDKRPGTNISLAADAYRRFGWLGIPPVVFAGFFLYGLACQWMISFWRKGTVFGWSLLVFSMMYFWSRPFGTLLGTWWSFFYDTPKHLLALYCVCVAVCFFAKRPHQLSTTI